MPIGHLEYDEPKDYEDVHVGTFYYKNRSGEDVSAEFFIHTVKDGEDLVSEGERGEAFNQQLTEEWTLLHEQDATEIKFKECRNMIY